MSAANTWPAKAPVVGTPISLTSYQEVLNLIETRPRDRATVVAVCTVHSVMTARQDQRVAAALQGAEIATPDGMPLVWALRLTANRSQTRVYGPDLMETALQYGVSPRWRHYLYGTTEATLRRLSEACERIAPGVEIVGSYAPPFVPMTPQEETETLVRIRQARPDVVWVGLGMPKQELWMHRCRKDLPGTALVGVGAAFDMLSETVLQAPKWMQRAGLEWLYRLSQEPRRLWRRYLFNNPLFLLLLARQILRFFSCSGSERLRHARARQPVRPR